MFKRILVGAVAGAAATGPQSLVVWGLARAGVYHQPPPPEQVAEAVAEPVVDINKLPDEWQLPVKLAQHVAFGAGCGAAFGLVTGIVRPTTVAGVLAGLGIWKASYDGWIPALGIMPPPQQDERGRALSMVLAHIVYGLALGLLMERWAKQA
jgi:hypothetical protein